MTRCNYIPPDDLSVIALAKERGGTTDGDIQAMVDRFGCKAEAAYQMTAEEDSDREQFSCIDHVGHLCGDGYWLVEPVYRPPSDVAISIVNTQGIARAGFGSPMILAPVPTTTPIVDLGTNPTREQVHAAGFNDDSDEYRRARAANTHRPPNSTGFDPNLVADATAAGGYIASCQFCGSRQAIDALDITMCCPSCRAKHGLPQIDALLDAARYERHLQEVILRALTSDDPTRAAPYAIGDKVRWRKGPCDFVWHLGRVTSIVDDRPPDGIDKPFWIVRVDTAGERCFAGPVIPTCLRREYPTDGSPTA